MKKWLIIQFLLIVALFYAGLHLLIEERNYLKGFYPESYEKAGYYLNISAFCVALTGLYVGYVVRRVDFFEGVMLALLSFLMVLYTVFLGLGEEVIRVEMMLRWVGHYIILTLFLVGFMLLSSVQVKKI